MSFKEFIKSRCSKHILNLEQLSAANVNDETVNTKFNELRKLLRDLYKLQPEVFSPNLFQRIESCTSVGSLASPAENLISQVNSTDTKFILGHVYLAEEGAFKIVKIINGYPIITPDVYPKCNTLYYLKHMWEQHRSLLAGLVERQNAIEEKQSAINRFASEYTLPNSSAKEELEFLKAEYDAEIISAHKEFLKEEELPYKGTHKNTRSHRVSHCYKCGHRLDNEIDTECNACNWIVCSCGACGCGTSWRQH